MTLRERRYLVIITVLPIIAFYSYLSIEIGGSRIGTENSGSRSLVIGSAIASRAPLQPVQVVTRDRGSLQRRVQNRSRERVKRP